jgi:hypothetical protein
MTHALNDPCSPETDEPGANDPRSQMQGAPHNWQHSSEEATRVSQSEETCDQAPTRPLQERPTTRGLSGSLRSRSIL